MFLACLLMAVRGLGFLMLTWITVVLLGGFVTNLGTVDFWALTVIALLQIIGVFSLFQEIMKYRDIGNFGPNLFPDDWFLSMARWWASVCSYMDPDEEPTGPPCMGNNALDDLNCCLYPILTVILFVVLVLMVVAIFAVASLALVLFVGGMLFWGTVIFLCLALVTVVQYGPVIVAIWSMVRVIAVRTHFFTSASDGPGVFGSNAGQLPNLIPAVDAAYWLGVAQGAVLLYWHLCHLGRTRIIKSVTRDLGLETDTVRHYCHETAAGCEKDLTFAVGRNLITYAVELLESKSPDKFLWGTRILGTFIRQQGPLPDEGFPEEQSGEFLMAMGRLVLIKQLLTGSESFCHLIEELLQMLGPRSPYCLEIRMHTARIVLLVAHKIYLDEHPRCIQCVCSLLDAFEEHQRRPRELRDTPYERDWCLEPYERGWLVATYIEVSSDESVDEGDDSRQCDLQAEGYIDMVRLGLSILGKLAADDRNCSVMCSTDGFLSRIMAPVCSKALHLRGVDPQPWECIAAASLATMYRLVQATGEAGKALRSNIIGTEDTIRAMERILHCQERPALEKAMDVLTLLGMQETLQGFIQFLFSTFADGSDGTCKDSIRTLAGRKLALLSSQKADLILTLDGILVSLKDIFTNHPRSTFGIIAVEIMDHLCGGNYTEDGERHNNMKNAMTAVMPQVLTELFFCGGLTEQANLTGIEEATPTGTEGAISICIPLEDGECNKTMKNAMMAVMPQVLTELLCCGGSTQEAAPTGIEEATPTGTEGAISIPYLQGNSQNARPPSHQQNREAKQKDTIEWQKALLSLSTKFFDKYASHDDQILPSLLDEVAPKLRKMADANMHPTTDSLEIMKLIAKLVISLVRNGYVTEGMDSLMASLTRASNKMMDLDGPVLCSPGVEEGGANKTLSTLCSLVEEAQKLVDNRNAREGSVVQDRSGGK
ncbi:unnamed protein product [Urochloa humidicola]